MRVVRAMFTGAVLCGCAAVAVACGASSTGVAGGAAGVVPASVPAFIAIDTDPSSSQWKIVEQLAARFPDKQKAIDSLEADLRKQDGIDYQNDVRPALGPEIDVVWLDLEHNGTDVVGLTKPGDEAAFERLVAKGNAADKSSKLVFEKVGDWEVFADKQALVDRFVIASAGSGPKLGDDPEFKSAMGSTPGDSIVKAYVSGQRVMDAITRRAGGAVAKITDQLGTLEWVTAALSASSDGVRFETAVRGTPGKLLKKAYTTPSFHASLPGDVPAGAVFYLGFHGAQGMLDNLGSTPQLAGPQFRPVAQLLRRVGALLQGEDALYARGASSGKIPEITLVTEPGSGTDGVSTLDGILAKYHAQLKIAPKTASFGGVQGRRLALGPFQLDYANVGGKFVVTDLPQGITSLQAPSSTLSQSESFKDAVDASGLPSKTQGFVYVDVSGGIAMVQHLAHTPIPGSVARNLKPLRSLVEYAASKPSEVHVTFFLRIK
jgi:hypothetical protein